MAFHSSNNPPARDNHVILMGLDFGSTTSSAVVAKADLASHCVTGRMQFENPRVVYRSEPVFTPFRGNLINEGRVEQHVDEWLRQSGIRSQDVFAGTCIITGLAARRANAGALAGLVQKRIGEALTATADDPSLESWLAFMGGCSALSRHHSTTPIINLDIGGGTTNPALGLNGDVLSTGSYFIGARHFQFDAGTYQLSGASTFGSRLLDHLGLQVSIGERLREPELDAILGFYITALEAIVMGERDFFEAPAARLHEQAPMSRGHGPAARAITFSGGVGELIYRHKAGEPMPGTTHFGDLGIDLAVRVAESPLLSGQLDSFVPENLGRATVYGLTLHSAEVSGTTLFLPCPAALPLRDLPVVARLQLDSDLDEVRRVLSLAKKCTRGACIQVLPGEEASTGAVLTSVKTLGRRLAQALVSEEFPRARPVVILTPDNLGHAIGNYCTNWRRLPVNLIVIDEIPSRDAQFVNIGRLHNNIVPITFYGLH
jgi:ethanolamine utilization protein EutA